jgi:hypothetical protein
LLHPDQVSRLPALCIRFLTATTTVSNMWKPKAQASCLPSPGPVAFENELLARAFNEVDDASAGEDELKSRP